MELKPIFKRVIGLDVHPAQITACALIEEADGTVAVERQQFGAFERDRRALATWCAERRPVGFADPGTAGAGIRRVTSRDRA